MGFLKWWVSKGYRAWSVPFAKYELLRLDSKERAAACAKLAMAKQMIWTPAQFQQWVQINAIKWTQDSVDFIRDPLVTISKLGGDCEDLAELGWTILVGKMPLKRLTARSKEGRGHTMLLSKINSRYTLISNGEVIGEFDTEEEAARYWYEDLTSWYVIY